MEISGKWTKRTKKMLTKWPKGGSFDKEICDLMLGVVTNHKAKDNSVKRRQKRELEMTVLKWFKEKSDCAREIQLKKNYQLSNETMCPPPYAPANTENREMGLYPMLPVASEGLQPLAICPVMKGHLRVEGWIQDKNAEPTEAEKAAMLQEEQRLMQMRQIAQVEEERVKELKEALEEATKYNKEIGDTYKKLIKQREEFIEKVDIMKKLKPRRAEETQEGEGEKRHEREGEKRHEGEGKKRYEERGSEKPEHRFEETKTEEAGCSSFWEDLQKGPRKKDIDEHAIEKELRKLKQTLRMENLSLLTDSEGSEGETGQMEVEEPKKGPRQSERVKKQVYKFEVDHRRGKKQAKGIEPTEMAPMLVKSDGWAQYVPWSTQDMQNVMTSLPDLQNGASPWIRVLEEETTGRILAVGDLKALLGKVLGMEAMLDIFEKAGYPREGVQRAEVDGVPFNNHRGGVWAAMREI